MKVYVAGPMRGIPGFNFKAFDQATNALEVRGHATFSPADNDRGNGFNPVGLTGHEDLAALGFDLRNALAEDMRVIAEWADAVAVLAGWENSSGARAEVALAHALGLPVARWQDAVIWTQHGGPATHIPDYVRIKADTPPSGTLPSLKDAATAYEKAKAQAVQDSIKVYKENLLTGMQARSVLGMPAAPGPSGEVRTVSATGGEKGSKPERHDLIPVEALATVAQLYGRGAAKYAAHNWRRGYEWSKSYAALQRHATQFWAGEDNDAEMGLPHMASVAFHALALLTFMDEQRQFDDRYKAPEASE
ncbi:dATP/dGTP diphosphohydrolase domain-containing protein [Arthrobacter sp. efr-133-TYG-118]|uniref:dATP/dGTP diphosphohydrolase domain-containing protein n=1 Tax=Arthrobacter sp. efr-133-TYG-118 TaxID=3040279 RepID=UPI00254D7D98|nr:dATP/dGTP diphosphohydrolase domain-containing protein [Arthrobacter sp. efr-133-TYG-118]